MCSECVDNVKKNTSLDPASLKFQKDMEHLLGSLEKTTLAYNEAVKSRDELLGGIMELFSRPHKTIADLASLESAIAPWVLANGGPHDSDKITKAIMAMSKSASKNNEKELETKSVLGLMFTNAKKSLLGE